MTDGHPAPEVGFSRQPVTGWLEGKCHVLPVRVYYEDTDAGQVVYYANYLKFMERGRSDFLRLLDIDQQAMMAMQNPDDVLFMVRRVNVEYLAAAQIDDSLEIWTSLEEIGGAKLIMRQSVKKGPQTIIIGDVVVVCVKAAGKVTRIPDHIRVKLLPYVQA